MLKPTSTHMQTKGVDQTVYLHVHKQPFNLQSKALPSEQLHSAGAYNKYCTQNESLVERQRDIEQVQTV